MSVLVLVSVYAFGNNLSMVIIVVYNFVRGQQPLEEDKYLVVSFKQFPQINVFHLWKLNKLKVFLYLNISPLFGER